MLYVAEEDVERFIREDAPYIDLTTLVLGIGVPLAKKWGAERRVDHDLF